jgi:predicted  nucleic acid-binding Zn-ribbon protein
MLIKTFCYDIVKCTNCDKWIIYRTIDGIPTACPKCGCPSNYEVTAQDRQRMEEHNRNAQSFNIRFG